MRDFRFRMFTDRYVPRIFLLSRGSNLLVTSVDPAFISSSYSDHSISTRGANRELYEWMTAYLVEKWGKGGSRRT